MREFATEYIPIPILLLHFQMRGNKDIPAESVDAFVGECIYFLSKITVSPQSLAIVEEIVTIANTVTEHLCSKVRYLS